MTNTITGLAEPTDRQMIRVQVRDPEVYAELQRRIATVNLAHMAVFGDRGVSAGDVARTAETLARGLARAGDERAPRAAELVAALISPAEREQPHTWATPLGRVLVMLGAYPEATMPRVTAQEILWVSRQRISQMVDLRLLATGGLGIQTASLVRMLEPA